MTRIVNQEIARLLLVNIEGAAALARASRSLQLWYDGDEALAEAERANQTDEAGDKDVHRYRALLIDSGNTVQERPVHIFGNHRVVIDDWAKTVLERAVSPDAVVKVFESVETEIARIPKAL